MTDRHDLIAAFLDRNGWGDADRTPLAQDASMRQYERLVRGSDTAMLMDAPPEKGEDVRPFVGLAKHFSRHGFSTPRILAEDKGNGLLILEDLGDALFARKAAADPASEVTLYAAAGEVLGAMHDITIPGDMLPYTPQMPELAALAIDWYAPEAAAHRNALVEAMVLALRKAGTDKPVVVHRDFHAENLIWLPTREGIARIGLLDFQDAMTGPPEYDLASLVHDPRRIVSQDAKAAAIDAYLAKTGKAAEVVERGIAICSAQRSLRILGVFARLCLRDSKMHYPDFIPRTWAMLQADLRHPALAELAKVVAHITPPDTARIAAIKARAGSLKGATKVVMQ